MLKEVGFVINRYDPCVANMIIQGKQATIAWHVDDCKVSHKDPEVVTSILSKNQDRFRELSITRGKSHTFVGMDLFFQVDGSVRIEAKQYIRESIRDFGEDFSNNAITPAGNDLFEVKDEGNLLPEDKSQIFHSIIGKLIFLTKRTRPDITLAVSFLCTRVTKSTHEDWNKLKRLLR